MVDPATHTLQNAGNTSTDHVIILISNPRQPCLEDDLTAQAKNAVAGTRLVWLAPGEACEIHVSGNRVADARQIISKIIESRPVDLAILPAEQRKKRALIADMDSTMIDQECIDELAAEVGVKDKVSKITAAAMNGEIEFESALRERVALLKGLPATIADEVIKNRISLARGGKTLLTTMNANGAHCALVSGGFTLFTSCIAAMLGFDQNHANVLEVKNGMLTGTVREPILGASAKVEALQRIAREQNLSMQDFIAVGDGANDLPMLKIAGLGVALHAKPAVAEEANICINHGDLTALLYLQGYTKDDFVLSDA